MLQVVGKEVSDYERWLARIKLYASTPGADVPFVESAPTTLFDRMSELLRAMWGRTYNADDSSSGIFAVLLFPLRACHRSIGWLYLDTLYLVQY